MATLLRPRALRVKGLPSLCYSKNSRPACSCLHLAFLSSTGVGCFVFKKIEGKTLPQQQDKCLHYHETCFIMRVWYWTLTPRCSCKRFFEVFWNQTCRVSEVCLCLNSALTVGVLRIDCLWFSLKGQAYFLSISADLSEVCFSNYRGYYQAVKWIIYMANLHCLLTVSENDIRASSERQICWCIILRRPLRFLFPEMDL